MNGLKIEIPQKEAVALLKNCKTLDELKTTFWSLTPSMQRLLVHLKNQQKDLINKANK